MKTRALHLIAILGLLLAGSLQAQESTLAPTPPMGWNSWNKFACNVSEDMIKSMADAMVKSGMKDAGYQYVNIDDCWQVSRDAAGNIVAGPQRFPHGMKARLPRQSPSRKQGHSSPPPSSFDQLPWF